MRASGAQSLPPGQADITSLLQPGANVVEIEYQAPIRNALIGAWREGDKRLRQFKKREGKLVPAGLCGPIQIIELDPQPVQEDKGR